MTMAQGTVLERDWKAGRGYALRFRAYGERRYLTLGFEHEGWTREAAEEALADVLAEVRLGVWVPPRKSTASREKVEEAETVLFGPFARQLVASREGQVSENQHAYDEWALAHQLPYFADRPMAEIEIQTVDAYRHRKVREADARRRAIERRKPLRDEEGRVLRPLGASSINKTIDVLQWVLSVALEYKLIAENPALGERRRLKEPQKPPVFLDTAEQIEALLDAAKGLDEDPAFKLAGRRAILATLLFAGPRAIELAHMLWRDVDLANGRIFVGRSKTRAGLREIEMAPVLRDLLAAHKASAARSEPDDLVFATETGSRRDKDNLRAKVLAPVFERADELLGGRGRVPLPRGLTPHKLRHTFASVLIACGEDPISVMGQLGHTDPAFTLRTYAHMMSREAGERVRLKSLVNGERVVAVPTPPPGLLECSAYEMPILRALAERGGVAPRREVRDSVAVELALGERDREVLPSGREARWEARLDKARERLVGEGLLRADSARGVWEMARPGVERLHRARAKGSGSDAPAETREALAA